MNAHPTIDAHLLAAVTGGKQTCPRGDLKRNPITGKQGCWRLGPSRPVNEEISNDN
jgi:hypothetical protein